MKNRNKLKKIKKKEIVFDFGENFGVDFLAFF